MKEDFYIPIALLFIASVVSLVRLLIYQHKLYTYLRVHHTEKWKELITILGFGPGCGNSWRWVKFLLGKDDLGDPEVLRLMVIVRNSYIYVVTGFAATFIMFVIMVACTVGLKFG